MHYFISFVHQVHTIQDKDYAMLIDYIYQSKHTKLVLIEKPSLYLFLSFIYVSRELKLA